MGWNTIVMFRNDAWGQIQDNADDVIRGIGHASQGYGGDYESVSAGYHGNAVEVMRARHADDFMIYAHTGNGLIELSGYSSRTLALAARDKTMREWIEDSVHVSEAHLNSLKKALKDIKAKEAKEQQVL